MVENRNKAKTAPLFLLFPLTLLLEFQLPHWINAHSFTPAPMNVKAHE